MDSRKNINTSPSARYKQDCKAGERMTHITGIMKFTGGGGKEGRKEGRKEVNQ
jgi:hypothetical protein